MNSMNGTAREPVLARVRDLVDSGKFDEALGVIAASGIQDPLLVNAAGVCHLRAGRPARAVEVFRGLCVGEGVGIRRGAPPLHVANYASALLLAENLSGYRNAVRSLDESSHPDAARLRAAVTGWERSLGRWRRLALTLGVWLPKQPFGGGPPPGEL